MSTLSLCINPLESSSKEHLRVYTSRTDKGGWCLAERVARTRAAADVSLFVFTLPGPPRQAKMNSELTRCDALHSALCAAALNASASASACDGGCQRHLDSIDQAPTWRQTINSVSLIINPNDRWELGLLQRKDHAWSLWRSVLKTRSLILRNEVQLSHMAVNGHSRGPTVALRCFYLPRTVCERWMVLFWEGLQKWIPVCIGSPDKELRSIL